jgi:hypothetical protein
VHDFILPIQQGARGLLEHSLKLFRTVPIVAIYSSFPDHYDDFPSILRLLVLTLAIRTSAAPTVLMEYLTVPTASSTRLFNTERDQ